jgi:CHAT domain-containing protein
MDRSGLALAGAQPTLTAWLRGQVPDTPDDGILTAAEVASLHLSQTWLVVLSACDTGQGEAQASEGVLGMRRGFVLAGAGHLLMTLWPVSDVMTSSFMQDFYSRTLTSGQPATALADVQREWLVRLRASKGLAQAVTVAGPFVLTFQGPPPGDSEPNRRLP